MTPHFLCDTYATEREKVLSVWAMFRDEHMLWRPADPQRRGRSVHEQMVHQCLSEDTWFKNMLGIDTGKPPLPAQETRANFLQTYAELSAARLESLKSKPHAWWDEEVKFFDVQRSRAWVIVRRMLHTSHHRGQLTAYLRMLGVSLHSTYGPTSDTGGLAANGAKVIYPYDSMDDLLGDASGTQKHPLPGPITGKPCSERP